jgi:Ca2+-binding RTX toxin-like protein
LARQSLAVLGRVLLVGGMGADRIVGNADDDILIAGYTSHDTNPAALDAIMDEWTRTDTDATYQQRIDRLKAGVGLNGSVSLDSSTVSRDGAVDILTGSAGLDWFWFDEPDDRDRATDLKDEAFTADLDWILVDA